MSKIIRFKNFSEVMAALEDLKGKSQDEIAGEWNLCQHLVHCAQAIEYSMEGYPTQNPIILQYTVGQLVSVYFRSRGYMRHNVNKKSPGAPEVLINDPTEGITHLQTIIQRFDEWTAPLLPHYFYGPLSKKNYEKAHAMHLADHFQSFSLR